MRSFPSRLRQFALLLGAAMLTMSNASGPAQQTAPATQSPGVSTTHDFDFLVGTWKVQHRRLKRRLVHSTEWVTFSGTSKTWQLMDGQGDVDDNVLEAPTGTYRAVTLRSFDPDTKLWSIWWLDSRHQGALDPPVIGSFSNGTGTFFAKDTFNGQPIVVRYIWSDIAANSAKWEQAFSPDDGKTWEVNWIMVFSRI